MRAHIGLTAAVLTLAGLAACTPTPKPQPVAAAPAPAAEGTKQCILLTNIRESRVISDQIIDFHMNNGQIYRNTLPFACPGLGMSRAFGYETSINQFCNLNTITVIVQGGGPRRGATCGLGMFVPYTPPAKQTPAKP